MECASKAAHKPSNISDIVSKFAKVCKLRSIGVFNSEQSPNSTEDDSDTTEGEKVHPHPILNQAKTDSFAEVEVLKLFDTITALKLAYVQLQEAHIPYDPDKITAANELVVSQFVEVYKFKRAYKEKQLKDVKAVSRHLADVIDEIQVQEKLLEKMKSRVEEKNSEILNLHRELEDMDLLNEKLSTYDKKSSDDLDVPSLDDIFQSALSGIHDFAKPLISLMKASNWDLDQAVNSIKSSVIYSKKSDKKYAIEAYIARKMFYEEQFQYLNIKGVLNSNNPIDNLIEDPNSAFAEFCRTKYVSLIHPIMEASFFGNLDHRTLVSNGKHPKTPFYEAYVKMAKCVWILQGIAASSEPKAEMYVIKRGSEFSDAYMDSVVDLNNKIAVSSEEKPRFKVEFMVMPGFRSGKTFVKSRVYLSPL